MENEEWINNVKIGDVLQKDNGELFRVTKIYVDIHDRDRVAFIDDEGLSTFKSKCKPFKSKFKPGDTIRIAVTSHDWFRGREHYITTDTLVVSHTSDYSCWGEFDNKPIPVVAVIKENLGYIPEMFCELVEEEDLRVEDLVEGEIYKVTEPSNNKYFIIKFKGIHDDECRIDGSYVTIMGDKEYRAYSYASCFKRIISIPTQEEKDWLNACIKENRFIPKEEALKSKVNKLDVGTYVVCLVDGAQGIGIAKKGDILVKESNNSYRFITNGKSKGWGCSNNEFKWFTTLQEAEAFVKTLTATSEYVLLLKDSKYDFGASFGTKKPVIGQIYPIDKTKPSSGNKLFLKVKPSNHSEAITLVNAVRGEDYIFSTKEAYEAQFAIDTSKPGDPDYTAEVNDFKQAKDVGDWLNMVKTTGYTFNYTFNYNDVPKSSSLNVFTKEEDTEVQLPKFVLNKNNTNYFEKELEN